MNTSLLLLGVLVSSVGLGYALYGRRQRQPIALVCGIVLMIVPYVISSIALLALVGVVVAALPWMLRRYL